ncbi:MAG: restriction endonuclease subunit S [Proteobacteria bacterium]|nr:restriction endonuclease subunit S [Pseudomonadota bacterium]MBU4011043.1 restriction endonuclease subunit S [Pseudomonadota bacterium]
MKLRKEKWKVEKIGNVCQVISGGTPSRNVDEYFGIDISWFTPTEIPKDKIEIVYESRENITELGLKKSSAKILPEGTVLLTSRATIGLIAIAGKKVTTNQGFANFICIDKVLNNWYLAYWLNSKVNLIKSLSSGTTFKEISKTTIRNLKIPLPPLEEQKQIAALFQSIETAIGQVEGQEKNLLKLKNQLLRELFGEMLQFGNYLNKNDFEKIKFEKIALNISERVEPQKTTLDTYVGLEHLDPDNLVIARTGKPDDVIGTKLKIYKGDIIFGKRRAYQRKVSVSHFDGIASAHSMILRANEKNIEKDFLPFFMQSDVFMNRAVQISEGSLSPTIKWKTLASQEFILPKKEKQKRITEVFKQFDITKEQLKQQKTTLKNLKQKLLSEILG